MKQYLISEEFRGIIKRSLSVGGFDWEILELDQLEEAKFLDLSKVERWKAVDIAQASQFLDGDEPFFRVADLTVIVPDVSVLVEALEKLARLGNEPYYGNSDGNVIAREAMSAYRGK